MQFATPTTEDQMHEILRDIFVYYRVKRGAMEEIKLTPLTLTRMQFSELTETQLREKARKLCSAGQTEKIIKNSADYQTQIEKLYLVLSDLAKDHNQNVEKVVNNFNLSYQKIFDEAIKNGMAQSSVVTSELSKLEIEKNDTLQEMQTEYDLKVSETNAKITLLEEQVDELEVDLSDLFDKQVEIKYLELKDEQDKIAREVFKYNNSLDEKEQRSRTSIAETNASIQLKYMEITSAHFTKDQLIDMGYYEEVIDCICAYYDTFSPLVAAQKVTKNTKLITYLDGFYQDLIYMYNSRAQL